MKEQLSKPAVKQLSEAGYNRTEIADILGLSWGRITQLVDRNGNQKSKHASAVKTWQRKHFISTSGGVRIRAEKRERPDECEMCDKQVSKLDYHHWNSEKPQNGIWVCMSCHQFVERVDSGLVIKYTKLRDKIDNP